MTLTTDLRSACRPTLGSDEALELMVRVFEETGLTDKVDALRSRWTELIYRNPLLMLELMRDIGALTDAEIAAHHNQTQLRAPAFFERVAIQRVADGGELGIALWEVIGQSNAVGFNNASTLSTGSRKKAYNGALSTKRILHMEDNSGYEWTELAYLDTAETSGGYTGRRGEKQVVGDTGATNNGASPFIGIAVKSDESDFLSLASDIRVIKAASGGKHIDYFLPLSSTDTLWEGHEDARVGQLRSDIASANYYHQGIIWWQGEKNAADAETAADINHVDITEYQQDFDPIRKFHRNQLKQSNLPFYIVQLNPVDDPDNIYVAALNTQLEGLCRYTVESDGSGGITITDNGSSGTYRDDASYFIKHDTNDSVSDNHANMDEMVAIGELIVLLALSLNQGTGFNRSHLLDSVAPTFLVDPAYDSNTSTSLTFTATGSEASTLYAASVVKDASAPSDSQIIAGTGGGIVGSGNAAVAGHTASVDVTVSGLTANTAYDTYFVLRESGGTVSNSETVLDQSTASAGAFAHWVPSDHGATWWYPADYDDGITGTDAAPTALADQTSNGYDLTITATSGGINRNTRTLNSRKVLDFEHSSSGNQFMEGTAFTAPANFYIAIVMQPDTHPGARVTLQAGDGNASEGFEFGNSGSSGWFPKITKAGGDTFQNTSVDYAGEPHIFGISYDGTTMKLWVDGEEVATNTVTGTVGTAFNPYKWMKADGSGQGQDGFFAEAAMVAFADQEELEGSLAHKWGLTSELPSGHAYKSSPPSNS